MAINLPGIYSSASEDEDNSLDLHPDYSIWSNRASSSANTKISGRQITLLLRTFFVAEAAEHSGTPRVSPYLAFLTQMHSKIAASGPLGRQQHPKAGTHSRRSGTSIHRRQADGRKAIFDAETGAVAGRQAG